MKTTRQLHGLRQNQELDNIARRAQKWIMPGADLNSRHQFAVGSSYAF